MKTVIMAGGRGTRISSIASDIPKPMIKIEGKPVLEYEIENDKPMMTNEEWLRQCSTEELVKMILDLCDDRPCFACGIGYCDDENWCHVYSDEAREFVLEWLKQAHKPIS